MLTVNVFRFLSSIALWQRFSMGESQRSLVGSFYTFSQGFAKIVPFVDKIGSVCTTNSNTATKCRKIKTPDACKWMLFAKMRSLRILVNCFLKFSIPFLVIRLRMAKNITMGTGQRPQFWRNFVTFSARNYVNVILRKLWMDAFDKELSKFCFYCQCCSCIEFTKQYFEPKIHRQQRRCQREGQAARDSSKLKCC